MTSWLGTRELTTADGKRVEVAISTPHFVEPCGWECEVRFTVDGVERLERTGGVDVLHALEQAFFIAWRDSEAMGAAWVPFEVNSGFARPVMTSTSSHFDVPKLHAV